MKARLIQILSLAVLIGVWALIASLIGTRTLPGPADVVPDLTTLLTTGAFLDPLVQSLQRTAAGFILGFAIGLAYGITAAKVPWFSLSSSLLFNITLFAPTLLVIFLGIVMLGTHLIAIMIITAIVVGPNIAVYMRDVMKDLDSDIVTMADSYKASTRSRVQDIYLPYLVPPMLAASRIGFSMAWKVVMLAEVFGFPGGLGFQIRISYTAYDLPLLMAWLSIFVVALLMIEQVIRATEHRVVRWQP